jgi:hypothetical protein
MGRATRGDDYPRSKIRPHVVVEGDGDGRRGEVCVERLHDGREVRTHAEKRDAIGVGG